MSSELPRWIREKLSSIPTPLVPLSSVPFRPVYVRLRDGKTPPFTIFFGEKIFSALFAGGINHASRVLPTRRLCDHFPRELIVDPSGIAEISPSPNLLPLRVANRMHSIGETPAATIDFTLYMKDGSKFHYTLENPCYFLYYPQGYGQENVDHVVVGILRGIHYPQAPELLGGPKINEIFWCLYRETDEELTGISQEQPEIFNQDGGWHYHVSPQLTEEEKALEPFSTYKSMVAKENMTIPPVVDVITAKKGERYFIGAPKIVPKELLKRLTDLFGSVPYVDEGYYVQVYYPDRKGDKPHIMLAIKLSQGTEAGFLEIQVPMGKIIRETLSKDEYVDVTQKSKATRRLTAI